MDGEYAESTMEEKDQRQSGNIIEREREREVEKEGNLVILVS